MRFSERWLREWVPTRLDTTTLAERLTLAGLEVAELLPAAPPLEQVVVGEIVALEPHPRADRLRVCRVKAGGLYQVVCGAPNARVGLRAPLALPGARLPGGQEIEAVALRGVPSQGMLCSAAELGLEEEAAGLLELDPDARPGTPIARALALDDTLWEIELTPNRGDCLSIGGLAREVSALTGVRLRAPRLAPAPVAGGRRLPVGIEAGADCPRYCGRVVEGIDPAARTPLWMRERLRRCGLRAIHPVVDVTNYVMLELGQPLHGFDLARLRGGITVRRAAAGEEITLLDGGRVRLPEGTLVIADGGGPVAVAGIMGGRDSAVDGATRDVFLESAFFAPAAVAGRARALGLHTESSHRFERGVDPALQRVALERATVLLQEIAGGRAGPVVERRVPAHLPRRPRIRLRREALERLLGLAPPPREVTTGLGRLGIRLRAAPGGWWATPPSHRFDLARPCDLAEEVARLHGYDRIPEAPLHGALHVVPRPETGVPPRRLRGLLADRDYQEVVTYAFVDPDLDRLLGGAERPVRLANPLSADMAVLRSRLWPGLIKALRHNLHRQQGRVRLFELGRVFRRDGDEVAERPVVAALAAGPVEAPAWDARPRPVDFFDLKGDLEALLHLAGVAARFEPLADDPALHPGQAARVVGPAGETWGRLGRLHPAVAEALEVEVPVYLFELDQVALARGSLPRYRPYSRFPAIRRDLAVILPRTTPAERALEIIREAAGPALTKLELLDAYYGEGIDSKSKSLTFGLTLQDSSRTLTDPEVNDMIERVLAALASGLNAKLRQ